MKLGVVTVVLCLLALSQSFVSARAEPAASSTPQRATPKYIDLRTAYNQWGLPIKPQGRRDTCAVFTFTGALEFAVARGTGEQGIRLSEEYLNWAANEVANDTEDGSSYEDLIKAFDKWGICEQRFMPYESRFRGTRPTQYALDSARQIWELGFRRHWIAQRTENGLDDSHLVQMKKVLATGWPLCAYGRDHSILIVGYVDDPRMSGGGEFITRDSAIRRYETIFYEASKTEFGSVLWIDMKPQSNNEES